MCEEAGDAGIFQKTTGTKVLTAADTGPLEAALHAMRLSSAIPCWADASEWVTVTTSQVIGKYTSNGCDSGRQPVSGAMEVVYELSLL